MPGFDGTGPAGRGAGTGGRRGICGGGDRAGYAGRPGRLSRYALRRSAAFKRGRRAGGNSSGSTQE